MSTFQLTTRLQGSGKTLAYGLPILHHLLTEAYSRPIPSSRTRRPVRALILAPTRELALQVSSHLNECLNPVDVGEAAEGGDGDVPAEPKASKKGKGKAKANGVPLPAAPSVVPETYTFPPVEPSNASANANAGPLPVACACRPMTP